MATDTYRPLQIYMDTTTASPITSCTYSDSALGAHHAGAVTDSAGANTSGITLTLDKGETNVAFLTFQYQLGDATPNGSVWTSTNTPSVLNITVTSTDSNFEWSAIRICRADSSGVNLSNLRDASPSGAVVTASLDLANVLSSSSSNIDDFVVVTLVGSNLAGHATASITVTEVNATIGIQTYADWEGSWSNSGLASAVFRTDLSDMAFVDTFTGRTGDVVGSTPSDVGTTWSFVSGSFGMPIGSSTDPETGTEHQYLYYPGPGIG